jgi:NAD+ synthetase
MTMTLQSRPTRSPFRLETLLSGLPILSVTGKGESEVTGLVCDSRVVENGDLFFALRGSKDDGSRHALQAVECGAVAVVTEEELPGVTVPIVQTVDGFRSPLDLTFSAQALPTLGERLPDITEENLQSRCRGTILMAISNRTGAIVLTTGNKSELAVGYCTLYGDMNGGLAVLSDVPKQLVYQLARWINANHLSAGFRESPIPLESITKPPSAELRPDQTDQDSLPPYELLDQIIALYVEGRKDAAEITSLLACDPAVVQRILRLIDLSEYKRKQAAIGIKLSTVAFGSGRRYPIAQRWKP